VAKVIRLCSLECAQATVWQRYEAERARLDKKEGSLSELIQRFFQSQDFKDLSPTTQSDYRKYSLKVEEVFGRMRASSIKPEQVRRYMDLRGQRSRVQANREKAFLSRVFQWGYERGFVTNNPCKGVRKFTERPRDRYITDEEYRVMYELAPLRLKVAMEISYLCAARRGDVLRLKVGDLTNEGIFIKQGKTGKRQIKRWTPRLRAAIKLVEQQPRTITSLYIIHDGKGAPLTGGALYETWRTTKRKAARILKGKLDFTFHDIKAKSISDYEGDKQRFLGHKSPSQVVVYDRKIEVVDSLDPDQK